MTITTRTLLGAVGLAPAAILVAVGLTRVDVPLAWIHPLTLAAGLALCVALQLPRVVSARWDGEEASVHFRFAGRTASWLELALAALLAVTISGYLFLENFRPR